MTREQLPLGTGTPSTRVRSGASAFESRGSQEPSRGTRRGRSIGAVVGIAGVHCGDQKQPLKWHRETATCCRRRSGATGGVGRGVVHLSRELLKLGYADHAWCARIGYRETGNEKSGHERGNRFPCPYVMVTVTRTVLRTAKGRPRETSVSSRAHGKDRSARIRQIFRPHPGRPGSETSGRLSARALPTTCRRLGRTAVPRGRLGGPSRASRRAFLLARLDVLQPTKRVVRRAGARDSGGSPLSARVVARTGGGTPACRSDDRTQESRECVWMRPSDTTML